ncbi:OVARIAN TUMOR DOMAIN-containing deubiquitinating enzyme 9-like [Rutidosis leptorrhynchoides]|uniref:OVARIAN TUMOR DOMAIN-containing deubiquitinating enzyme 9-like n=1 Tax=Rutidosis leptorrhynchoides TaxID=125765 RepID=UPI003A9A4E5B
MWQPNCDEQWGPNCQDIEEFFSYGYYGDYGYQYHTNNNNNNDHLQPYNGSYYQQNQYPDVNNEMLISLEHAVSDLSIADHGIYPSHAVQEPQQQVSYPAQQQQVSPNAVAPEQVQALDPVGLLQSFPINQDMRHGSSSLINHYNGIEEVDSKKIDKSSSISSTVNQVGEWEDKYLEIIDDHVFDGEVYKRLDRIVPVTITPKVNRYIPSNDEVSSDHQRLNDRLKLYGFVESKVVGDGNCQFRALAEQLYRSPEYHKAVRRRVVNQLTTHSNFYEEYVPTLYTDYLRQISQRGEWGDHVTLQAAADSYGIKILVLTSFKDTAFIEIYPKVLKSNKVICLSYWAEVHYNSLYPVGEQPASQDEDKKKKTKKKKKKKNSNNTKWWNLKCITPAP